MLVTEKRRLGKAHTEISAIYLYAEMPASLTKIMMEKKKKKIKLIRTNSPVTAEEADFVGGE